MLIRRMKYNFMLHTRTHASTVLKTIFPGKHWSAGFCARTYYNQSINQIYFPNASQRHTE